MEKPDFVYVTYVEATPERVWDALTEPEFTQRFFRFRLEGPWRAGAHFQSVGRDGRPDAEGEITECDRPRRLALRWHKARIADEYKAVPRMVATCVIEPLGAVVRLTVTEHHERPVDEDYLEGGRVGWPIIASHLKTLVETGHGLPRFSAASKSTEAAPAPATEAGGTGAT